MADINAKTSKGLLGNKLGMTQVWDENNKLIPVTVIEITPNVVTQVRTPENDGYNAVQIAYGQIDPRKVNKPAAVTSKARASRRAVTSPRSAPPTPPSTRSARSSPSTAPSRPASWSTSSAPPRARASPVS